MTTIEHKVDLYPFAEVMRMPRDAELDDARPIEVYLNTQAEEGWRTISASFVPASRDATGKWSSGAILVTRVRLSKVKAEDLGEGEVVDTPSVSDVKPVS